MKSKDHSLVPLMSSAVFKEALTSDVNFIVKIQVKMALLETDINANNLVNHLIWKSLIVLLSVVFVQRRIHRISCYLIMLNVHNVPFGNVEDVRLIRWVVKS